MGVGGLVVVNSATGPYAPPRGTADIKFSVEGETPPPLEDLIKKYFGDDSDTAIAIAKCESSLNPLTIGDKHLVKPSIGLFQINQRWHGYSVEELQNPEFNCKVAKEIFDRWGNWNAWTCYKSGGYLRYL